MLIQRGGRDSLVLETLVFVVSLKGKIPRKEIDHVRISTNFQNRKMATNGVSKPPNWLIFCEDFAMILLHILAKSGPQRRPRKGQKRPKTHQENLGQIVPNAYVYVVSRPPIVCTPSSATRSLPAVNLTRSGRAGSKNWGRMRRKFPFLGHRCVHGLAILKRRRACAVVNSIAAWTTLRP